MEFLKRVSAALVESDSEEENENEGGARRQEVDGADATSTHASEDEEEEDDIKALMTSALSFTKGALATIKHATNEVSNELKESFRDIKAQVEEDLRPRMNEDDDLEDDEDISLNDDDDRYDEQDSRRKSTVMVTSDGTLIAGSVDDDDENNDDALDVQDTFEQVGEKIELLGQKMFQGAGQLANLVKTTTQDAIEETRDVIKETRDAFTVKETKIPRRARDEFVARLQTIQRDSGTYTEDPSKEKLFRHFAKDFSQKVREKDIADVLNSNNFMKELFARIVPGIVDEDAFWCRYFYKVYELEIEFGRKLAPLLPPNEASENINSQNLVLGKFISHNRVESLATDEESFDSDESLAKEEWTKIRPAAAATTNVNESVSLQTEGEGEASADEAVDDILTTATSNSDLSDIDEDWGLK